jgi:NAD+ kinase
VKVERATVITNDRKPLAKDLQPAVAAFLAEHSIEVVEDAPDLVLSLGGDGTMLRAAQLAHAADAPLLGINLGNLGYLSEVDADGWKDAIGRIISGDHDLEERMMLACEVDDGTGAKRFVGLNEVLVERSTRHRLVRLSVTIDGESLAAFNADGIIVATPTGSTAYALSAGGPIVSPRAECLVVVPVSPHMIFSRPFVLAADVTVELSLEGTDQEASVALDGAIGCDIGSGTTVIVRRHPRPLRLVRLSGPAFLERLRSKLGLPG